MTPRRAEVQAAPVMVKTGTIFWDKVFRKTEKCAFQKHGVRIFYVPNTCSLRYFYVLLQSDIKKPGFITSN